MAVTGEGGPAVPLGPANLAVRAAVALAQGDRTARQGRGRCQDRDPQADPGRRRPGRRQRRRRGRPGRLQRAVAGRAEPQPNSADIGRRIGSDVPFALPGGTAVGLGRGERLTAALVAGSYHWVLAFGAAGLSTPEVYAACDRLRAARGAKDGQAARGARRLQLSTELMAALRSGDPAAVGPLLTNDLQPAALSLQPLLRRALLGREGARRARRYRLRVRADLRVPGGERGRGPRPRGRAGRRGRVPRGRPGVRPGARRRRGGIGRPGVNLVNLEAAVKAYGTRVLLDHVSLGVAAGDRIGVVGRNGSGKTTLLAALAGAGRR